MIPDHRLRELPPPGSSRHVEDPLHHFGDDGVRDRRDRPGIEVDLGPDVNKGEFGLALAGNDLLLFSRVSSTTTVVRPTVTAPGTHGRGWRGVSRKVLRMTMAASGYS